MNNIKAIIFDFDGIVLESLDIKTEAFADMYKPYGEEVAKNVVAHHEANGGMSRFEKFKFYHNSYLNQVINDQQIKSLASRFSELALAKVLNAQFVPGVFEFISNYSNTYDFFISTGTPHDEIEVILEKRDLRKFFKEVYGSPEKKTEHVKRIMKNYLYNPSEVVFIGDATADRDAAQNNKINFIGRYTTNEEILKEKHLITDFINFNKYLEKL